MPTNFANYRFCQIETSVPILEDETITQIKDMLSKCFLYRMFMLYLSYEEETLISFSLVYQWIDMRIIILKIGFMIIKIIALNNDMVSISELFELAYVHDFFTLVPCFYNSADICVVWRSGGYDLWIMIYCHLINEGLVLHDLIHRKAVKLAIR